MRLGTTLKTALFFLVMIGGGVWGFQRYLDRKMQTLMPAIQGGVTRQDGVALPPGATDFLAAQQLSSMPNESREEAVVQVTTGTQIVMYARVGDNLGIADDTILRVKGLSCEVKMFKEVGEIKALGIMNQLEEAGIVQVTPEYTNYTFPFYSVDGKFWTRKRLLTLLKTFPTGDIREYPSPYIIAYGVSNCVFTERGLAKLKAAGLSFEFRDINDERFSSRYEVVSYLSGASYLEYPIIDVNGHILGNPSVEEVIKYYSNE